MSDIDLLHALNKPFTEPSLKNFGTIAFDPEVMFKLIEVGRREVLADGSIGDLVPCPGFDVSIWFQMMPECYRVEAWRGVEAVFPEFERRKIDQRCRVDFVHALRRWIGENVKPI